MHKKLYNSPVLPFRSSLLSKDGKEYFSDFSYFDNSKKNKEKVEYFNIFPQIPVYQPQQPYQQPQQPYQQPQQSYQQPQQPYQQPIQPPYKQPIQPPYQQPIQPPYQQPQQQLIQSPYQPQQLFYQQPRQQLIQLPYQPHQPFYQQLPYQPPIQQPHQQPIQQPIQQPSYQPQPPIQQPQQQPPEQPIQQPRKSLYSSILSKTRLIPNDCNYNQIKSRPNFKYECSKNEILSKANIILKLETNTDNTGNSNISVITVGSISFTKIDDKRCIYFKNSLNDYLKFKYCNTESFTLCYWIYVIDNGSYTALSISSGNFNDINDPVFQADFYDGNISNFVALPTRWKSNKKIYNYVKKWIHVAYTCNQKTFKIELFINGTLVSTANGTDKLKTHVNTYIMGRSGDTGRAFYGFIRNFCKFDFVLSPCQIKNIYEITYNSI